MYNRLDRLNRLDRMPARDRRTDILPRHSLRYAYVSRGKNKANVASRQSCKHRMPPIANKWDSGLLDRLSFPMLILHKKNRECQSFMSVNGSEYC